MSNAAQLPALALSVADQLRDTLAWDDQAGIYREWTGVWTPVKREDRVIWHIVDAMKAGGHGVGSLTRPREVAFLLRKPLSRPMKAHRGLIAFANGTLDAFTLEIREHDRNDGLTHLIPYDWDMSAPIGEWERLTTYLFGAEGGEERLALMMHLGLSLMGDTGFRRSLLIRGPANCGKTTLIRIANLLQGMEAEQFAGRSLFYDDTQGDYARGKVRDWPIVCLDEFPCEGLREEEVFKQMSAHSSASSRLPYGEPVYGQWRPKLMMASNDIPALSDRTGAVGTRLLILPCSGSIPKDRRDRSFLDRIRPELPGIAMACLIAATQGDEARDYPISARMRETYQEAVKGGDQMQAWVEECCVIGSEHTNAIGPLYESFARWAADNGHKGMSKMALTRRLLDYAPWGVTRTTIGKAGAKALRGIALQSLDLRLAQEEAVA